MPNLITQYDNGTFEDILANWGALFFSDGQTAVERNGDEFYEGAFSCRFTTRAKSASILTGSGSFLNIEWPAVDGNNYELRFRIKCSAGIPDDTIFLLAASNAHSGHVFPVLGSQAKSGWAEIRVNFNAITYPSGLNTVTSATLMAVCGTSRFNSTYPGFADLFPEWSDYYANTDIPAGEFIWIDAAFADVAEVPAITDPQFDGRPLYYVENIFLLSDGSNLYEIEEPINWDKVALNIIFDKSVRGYRFEFSDKDVLLEFDEAAGFSLLKQLFREKHTQAFASLKFGEINNDVLTIHFEAQINFTPDSYEEGEFTVKANVERFSFTDKFVNRYDKEVNIALENSLGDFYTPGIALAPLTNKTLYLHPRLLTKSATMSYNKNVPVEFTPTKIVDDVGSGFTMYYTSPPYKADIKTSNIPDWQDPIPPEGQLLYAGSLKPGVNKRVIVIESATAKVRLTTENSDQPVAASLRIFKQVGVSGPTPAADEDSMIDQTEDLGNLGDTFELSFGLAGTIELFEDEALFIRFMLVTGDQTFNATDFEWLDPESFVMTIREETVTEPSLIQVPLIHETLNRQLEIILDTPNPLRTTLFGRTDLGYASNGCAAFHFYMNGLFVRGFNDRPFNLSTKDWVNALGDLFCLGLSIERDDDNNEFVRVQELPYFFRSILLLKLDVISKYSKSPAGEYIFNSLKFGFKKFPQDNQNDSLEDFMTEMEYLSPLTRYNNPFEKTIDCILSGYYIEYTRQESFAVNPTNAYETDNDPFLISAKPSPDFEEVAVEWDEDANTISFPGNIIPLVTGDTFTIVNGPPAINFTYTVKKVDIPFNYSKVVITPTIFLGDISAGTGSGTCDVIMPAGRYQAKRDEDFDQTVGVAYPKSVYNLEHHIKRILIRWAQVFQAGWAFLLDDDDEAIVLQFLSGKNNTKVKTVFKEDVSCVYGQTHVGAEYYDGRGDPISNLNAPLFRANVITFEAPLTWPTLNALRKAFEGRDPDGKNYGYLQWPNPDKETEKGFILDLKFFPGTNMCKFVMIEKYENG